MRWITHGLTSNLAETDKQSWLGGMCPVGSSNCCTAGSRKTNSSPIPHCWGVRNDSGQLLSVEVRVGVLVWRQDKNEKIGWGWGKFVNWKWKWKWTWKNEIGIRNLRFCDQ